MLHILEEAEIYHIDYIASQQKGINDNMIVESTRKSIDYSASYWQNPT